MHLKVTCNSQLICLYLALFLHSHYFCDQLAFVIPLFRINLCLKHKCIVCAFSVHVVCTLQKAVHLQYIYVKLAKTSASTLHHMCMGCELKYDFTCSQSHHMYPISD